METVCGDHNYHWETISFEICSLMVIISDWRWHLVEISWIDLNLGTDLRFDQPWEINNSIATLTMPSDLVEPGERFILSDFAYSAGLGNLMFEYAALHYFAVKFNATIVIPSNCLLLRAFGQLKRSRVMDSETLAAYLSNMSGEHESKVNCIFQLFDHLGMLRFPSQSRPVQRWQHCRSC